MALQPPPKEPALAILAEVPGPRAAFCEPELCHTGAGLPRAVAQVHPPAEGAACGQLFTSWYSFSWNPSRLHSRFRSAFWCRWPFKCSSSLQHWQAEHIGHVYVWPCGPAIHGFISARGSSMHSIGHEGSGSMVVPGGGHSSSCTP